MDVLYKLLDIFGLYTIQLFKIQYIKHREQLCLKADIIKCG